MEGKFWAADYCYRITKRKCMSWPSKFMKVAHASHWATVSEAYLWTQLKCGQSYIHERIVTSWLICQQDGCHSLASTSLQIQEKDHTVWDDRETCITKAEAACPALSLPSAIWRCQKKTWTAAVNQLLPRPSSGWAPNSSEWQHTMVQLGANWCVAVV